MRKESAAAVARAVVRPEVAQANLSSPTSYRVPGAELLVIRVEVYTNRVITDATNPRILNHILFPAAVAPGNQRALFEPLEPPISRENDFSIVVKSLEQLIWQLDTTVQATIKQNVPRPPLIEQGIMEPPLAVPASIEQADGKVLAGTVLIREGSTRVSHAQHILGLTSRDVLVRYSEEQEQASLIAELNTIAQSSASSISLNDAGRVRVVTMPVDLVIGVQPDAGASTTLGEAVAAKVAQDHLNHKKQWDESAKDVHLGESCLIALRDESLLSDEMYHWLTGRMAAGTKVDGQAVHEDDRWTELIWLFTTRKRPQSTVIKRPIATVLEREEGRRSVRNRTDKVPLAVALAMRSRRGAITESAVERESRVLEGAVFSAVFEVTWVPTSTSLDDLAARAIDAAGSRSPSAAGVELAVRAMWYLARHGQLSMPRNDLGPGGDRRTPGELVTGMLASKQGIQQLLRTIQDGRAGEKAGYVVDEAGRVDISGIGSPVALRDDLIRTQLVPRSGPPAPLARNPREEFMDSIAALTRQLHSVVAADDHLRGIDDGHSRPMHEVEGIPSAQAADLLELIDNLRTHVAQYEINWRVAEAIRSQGGTGPQEASP
ncbi:hypothetical protein [Aquipuribacter sp. SD81]|uniref:hypothetical protein n=1 Tax=Aquipuribacter sp. SD81 TaxID=3127703 RepID=UPI003015F633